MAKKKKTERALIQNRKAFHDFHIEERFEAGLVLRGAEVKALREGRAQIREAYGMVRNGEAWLWNMHISAYSSASSHEELDPARPRKLLLHHQEIARIAGKTQQRGYTLVPLRVYFAHGLAKIELGLARGKQKHDRRRDIAERDAQLQMARVRRRREHAG